VETHFPTPFSTRVYVNLPEGICSVFETYQTYHNSWMVDSVDWVDVSCVSLRYAPTSFEASMCLECLAGTTKNTGFILGLCGGSAGFCMVFSTLSRILPKVSRLAADLRGTCDSFPEAVLLGSSKRPKVSHVTLLDSGKCRARLQSPLQLVLNQTPWCLC